MSLPSRVLQSLWPFRLEKRPEPSTVMRLASPLIAATAMALTGLLVFLILGRDPTTAFQVFFLKPLSTTYDLGELALKATPLMLCALGLALGFRANVWNIGAEGQLTLGAIAGGGIALFWGEALGAFALPVMMIAGALGGMAWAAIPAFLRTRFHTNEILVSLMLVYIAQQLLGYLVHGPWRDPDGNNFPQSKVFVENAILPMLVEGTRVTAAFLIGLLLALASWVFSTRTFVGYRMLVAGLAPQAAAYAGFNERRNIWLALLIGGGMAGLAGISEVAGPIGLLQPVVSPGYGFAAIIVAFVGRLHPFGIVLASLLMSLLYLGGEAAQIDLQLPSSITGLFQGSLLFYLLAADLFISFRLRRVRRESRAVATTGLAR